MLRRTNFTKLPNNHFITPIIGYDILILMIVNRENLRSRLKEVFPFNLAGEEQVSLLADDQR